jgi:hypothetical protein
MPVIPRMCAGLIAVVALTSCVSDEPTDDVDSAEDVPTRTVTAPPERLTPFCRAINALTDELLSSEVGGTDMIIETYRSLVDRVPPEIASDFIAVLEALENGAPPPTDPTVVTTVPTTSEAAPVTATPITATPITATTVTGTPVTDASGSTIPTDGDGFFEEGYGPGTSPAERVNEYVAFACRDTENNPGPPPTQPLVGPRATSGG